MMMTTLLMISVTKSYSCELLFSDDFDTNESVINVALFRNRYKQLKDMDVMCIRLILYKCQQYLLLKMNLSAQLHSFVIGKFLRQSTDVIIRIIMWYLLWNVVRISGNIQIIFFEDIFLFIYRIEPLNLLFSP